MAKRDYYEVLGVGRDETCIQKTCKKISSGYESW